MLLRLETATSARISLLPIFCLSSKNVLGQLADGFLFCLFFKRRRCAISNQLCKTLDGKCPAVRFGRMNNRPIRCQPIPIVRFVATSKDRRNLPEFQTFTIF